MNDDFLSLDSSGARAAQHNKAIEVAKMYVDCFVHTESGRKLLEQWTQNLARKRTPTNAPHTEYAANEAVRAFVEGIYDQIRIASSEARLARE